MRKIESSLGSLQPECVKRCAIKEMKALFCEDPIGASATGRMLTYKAMATPTIPPEKVLCPFVFLRCQYIALRANGEDGEGLGRFWQSRFKAVRILDEESLLAGVAYVDLNPIRADLAETLEASDYTSVQRRVEAVKDAVDSCSETKAEDISFRADAFLSPVSIDEANDPLAAHPSRSKKRCSDKGFLALSRRIT